VKYWVTEMMTLNHTPDALDVLIVGGGMITQDLLLPSLYHLQRTGTVGTIQVCSLNTAPLKSLKNSRAFAEAFPGQDFMAFPAVTEPPEKIFPDLYKDVIAGMRPWQMVVVAMPDQLHYPVVMEALNNDQHVLCVKPLVLHYEQAAEIERLAYGKGLFVGVEYHKRFDRRSLIAKRSYELNHFGDFVLGEAKLIEPYYYRNSNFQQWFTCDKTDPFVYIGCHYVDLVYFITGLKPVEVSVSGVKGKFPNGNEGYMWSAGRVRFENKAVLSVINGLGYPDQAAGSNDQSLQMFFEGNGKCGMLKHDDQFRGVEHSYNEGIGGSGSHFNYINPDFYKLIPWEGKGYKPAGYGFDSVSASLTAAYAMNKAIRDLPADVALQRKQEMIREIDGKGIIATPANSCINELVVEAARLSILNNGRNVSIAYGANPCAIMEK
jgi:D-galacturonate reductase